MLTISIEVDETISDALQEARNTPGATHLVSSINGVTVYTANDELPDYCVIEE